MAGKPTRQAKIHVCLTILQALSETQEKCTHTDAHTHTHTHTPHSDVPRHHLISAFIESVVSPFRDLGEGAFHCACQSPPSSTAIWNHNADSVTSKYL